MNRKLFEVERWQFSRTWKDFGDAMMAFIGRVGDKLKAWKGRASKRFWSPRAWVSLVVLIIVALVAYYILSDIYTPFTTDAYVQAYVVQVAPRVEGQVLRVCVEENQAVKKGELLFEIDPRPFEHALELLVAKRVEAVQKVAQLKAELAAAQAEDERLKAEEGYAKVVNDQEKEIYKRDATTDRLYVQAVQKYKAAQAAISRSRADVVKVEQALAALVGEEHALVAEVDAQLAQAKLNLEWTQIYAPANGFVTNVQLRAGSYVHVGSPVITFVDGDQWWIVANFRENEMRRIQAGQTARVAFRSAPASIFSGQVTSVGWGVSQGQGVPSGQLPDVKVPGNWVPPAQRFQVRVALDDPETLPMRVGMTGSVAVYTESGNPLNLVTGLWHRVIAWLYHL